MWANTAATRLKHRPEDDALVMRAQNNYLVALLGHDPLAALKGLQGLALLRQRVLGPNHPETALAHENISAVLLRLQRCEEAEREVRTALAALQSAGETNPLRLGSDQALLARTLWCLHRPEPAIAALEQGVALLQQGAAPEASLRPELLYLQTLLIEAKHPLADQERVQEALKQLSD